MVLLVRYEHCIWRRAAEPIPHGTVRYFTYGRPHSPQRHSACRSAALQSVGRWGRWGSATPWCHTTVQGYVVRVIRDITSTVQYTGTFVTLGRWVNPRHKCYLFLDVLRVRTCSVACCSVRLSRFATRCGRTVAISTPRICRKNSNVKTNRAVRFSADKYAEAEAI